MAIAHDADSSAQQPSATATTLSWTHTTGAGLSNSILVVGVDYYAAVGAGISVTSITYNGVGLTKIRRDNDGTHAATTELWYLLAPASGANTVFVTIGPIATGGGWSAGGTTFSGVDQTNPIDAQTGAEHASGSNSYSDNLTTVANNAWIVDTILCNTGAAGANTPQGSQQKSYDQIQNTTDYGSGSYLGPVSPAGSTAMGWTLAANSSAAVEHSLVSLKPSGGIVAVLHMLPILGVGK